jgi:hypothetical protein
MSWCDDQAGYAGMSATDEVSSGNADLAVEWLAPTYQAIASGSNITHVALMFTRAGMVNVGWPSEGIDSVEDYANHTICSWVGSESNVHALTDKYGMVWDSDPSAGSKSTGASIDFRDQVRLLLLECLVFFSLLQRACLSQLNH